MEGNQKCLKQEGIKMRKGGIAQERFYTRRDMVRLAGIGLASLLLTSCRQATPAPTATQETSAPPSSAPGPSPTVAGVVTETSPTVVPTTQATLTAVEFFGFNPDNYDGRLMPSETLKQMVEAAKSKRPPKNGNRYVFGFANLARDINFCLLVEQSIKQNTDLAGIELIIADNQASGPVALQVADSFVQRNVDFVIEFQTDVNFGPQIWQKFKNADIPVVAIDIPLGDAVFFGANNPYAGFLAGAYLAQAAIALWGHDRMKDVYAVVGELPQSGVVPKMRTDGEKAGILAVLKDLPKEQLLTIDTKNVREVSYTEMANLLGRIPAGAPILVTAINDGSTIGMLQAVKAAGRYNDLLAVGMNADELDTMMAEERMIGSVGFFPERYGNYLIPLALMMLAGYSVPPGVLIQHPMVTPANICEFYPQYQCTKRSPDFVFTFPEQEYRLFVEQLRKDPNLKDYQALLK